MFHQKLFQENEKILRQPVQIVDLLLQNLEWIYNLLFHLQVLRFHYIPTHASWMNQVEIWFSLLSRYALKGASFTSHQELRQAIDRFIAAYNPSAHPFEWTKEVVHPKGLKRCYAELSK